MMNNFNNSNTQNIGTAAITPRADTGAVSGMFPDYQKRETVNLIPEAALSAWGMPSDGSSGMAREGSWTADRDGFVYVTLGINMTNTTDTLPWMRTSIRVSGVTVEEETEFMQPKERGTLKSTVVTPVRTGDVVFVQLFKSLNIIDCSSVEYAAVNFIPSVFLGDGGDSAALGQILADIQEKLRLADLASNPQNWTVGDEQDFKDGTFGQRFTGILTAPAGITRYIEMPSLPITYTVISVGGEYYFDDTRPDAKSAIGSSSPVVYSHIFVNDMWRISTNSNCNRTNAPYDVWVRYTKGEPLRREAAPT